MRTYILALTKYGIAGIVIAYTLVAFFLLLKNQDLSLEDVFIQLTADKKTQKGGTRK